MKIAITGAGGFVGSALANAARARGDDVIAVPRGGTHFEGADAVVHLAGAPIAVRWTAARKKEIRDSRVLGTQRLAEAIATSIVKPRVFVCASAIGFYGDRGDEVLTETSGTGSDFLAGVVRDWEAAAAGATGARVVQLRFGIVLSPDGGALAKMLLPFRMGAGGRLGAGTQWMSWIGLHDLVRVILFAIDNASLVGAYNATSPNPVTNADFSATLGTVLHRPAIVPVPEFSLKLMFGEMAEGAMLASQRVLPARLHAAGFQFEDAELADAIRHELDLAQI